MYGSVLSQLNRRANTPGHCRAFGAIQKLGGKTIVPGIGLFTKIHARRLNSTVFENVIRYSNDTIYSALTRKVMKKRITNNRDRLEQEVVEWLIYLTSGEAMPNDFAEFAQWQKRSPAHTEAYRKISGLWDNLDKPLLAWRDQTDISIQPQSYNVQQSAAESFGIQKQSLLKRISGFVVTAVLLTVLFTSLFSDYLISMEAD
jgi:Domain of unknown function (DUF4880)